MCPERKWRPRGPGISRLGGPKARDTQEALEAQKWQRPKGNQFLCEMCGNFFLRLQNCATIYKVIANLGLFVKMCKITTQTCPGRFY